MLKKYFILAAAALLLLGLGCSSGSSPVVPDKEVSMIDFFNQFDLSSPVVGELIYSDYDGNILSKELVGKNENGFYIINGRNSQHHVYDLRPLHFVDITVTYNNPAGTIESGPNAGLPYYYVGQTVDYDINVDNMSGDVIGVEDCGADLTAAMHYASWDEDGNCVPGDLMPGEPTYHYNGIFPTGLTVLNDTYYIPGGTIPGLNCTVVRLEWDACNGLITFLYFDDCAGCWDPK